MFTNRIPPELRFGALGSVAALLAAFAVADSAQATTVSFSTPPAPPTLSALTLNGRAQTTTTTWTMTGNLGITSSGTNNGWNLTVQGSAAGGSAVFKQYCPNASCGTDSGPGYVAGGYTLPASSLMLNTTGAGWTTAGTKPTYQCNGSGLCYLDGASATKIVSASTSVALGTWSASGSSVLTLATPTTLHKLQTNEVYRVNLVWTLTSGP